MSAKQNRCIFGSFLPSALQGQGHRSLILYNKTILRNVKTQSKNMYHSYCMLTVTHVEKNNYNLICLIKETYSFEEAEWSWLMYSSNNLVSHFTEWVFVVGTGISLAWCLRHTFRRHSQAGLSVSIYGLTGQSYSREEEPHNCCYKKRDNSILPAITINTYTCYINETQT